MTFSKKRKTIKNLADELNKSDIVMFEQQKQKIKNELQTSNLDSESIETNVKSLCAQHDIGETEDNKQSKNKHHINNESLSKSKNDIESTKKIPDADNYVEIFDKIKNNEQNISESNIIKEEKILNIIDFLTSDSLFDSSYRNDDQLIIINSHIPKIYSIKTNDLYEKIEKYKNDYIYLMTNIEIKNTYKIIKNLQKISMNIFSINFGNYSALFDIYKSNNLGLNLTGKISTDPYDEGLWTYIKISRERKYFGNRSFYLRIYGNKLVFVFKEPVSANPLNLVSINDLVKMPKTVYPSRFLKIDTSLSHKDILKLNNDILDFNNPQCIQTDPVVDEILSFDNNCVFAWIERLESVYNIHERQIIIHKLQEIDPMRAKYYQSLLTNFYMYV
ncbi:hypothetical protein EDEG_01795 [Edhazardia aedis USNM 41457]|uniref:PH domain-containing protein n=1 Tax=Edhazardia aedis (strain USNM 41457) TaxID=1003232 RepID=J9DRF3_EDHAE|nr:hypothetical protein EDEG_01795 [Edhazardia aedis USNM 41457]|eukprot:EJW03917.1 hypothetical protein EDEG_01795 [Edhazardia aedis USNM 41457]